MKAYFDWLNNEGFDVEYLEFNEDYPELANVTCFDVADDWLKQKVESTYEVEWLESPLFLNQAELKPAKKYRMSSFYIEQRKQMKILLDGDGPRGGKWSFDSENRKKLPKDIALPEVNIYGNNDYVTEAKAYLEENFDSNYGGLDSFMYPVTRDEALEWLDDFMKHRFEDFGQYEDAIAEGESILFHSVLSPLINVGLLAPNEVVDKALEFKDKVPMNSLEGFVRQIIGWREFVYGVYKLEGVRQRNSNYFNHKRDIPEAFWVGETGIVPVDDVVKKLNKTGYSHHIERLMIISNFMNLCEFDPHQIYEWFMAMYIDAYDWVMVPNVYGMSLHADGGLITTKPYISSSNYVLKMSNYKKGEWCKIWDGLYWRFIKKHEEFFKNNPRLSVMTLALNRMSDDKLQGHLDAAENYLKSL
jgi:deoxyribodipyrimidine photolyase-related protein